MALIALYILKICYLCKSKTIFNGKLIFTQQLIKTSIMAKAKFFCAAVVMAFMAVIPASAQGVAFGVKGGVNFTKMSIDNDAVKSESGVGFFVGPTLKIDFLPFLGVQGAVMYEQANSKVDGEKIKRQSIIVPIDVRVNLKLSEQAGIYLATGPQFGFNVGETDFKWNETSTYHDTFQLKKSMFNWNFGIGAMLSKHLEIGATYSLGISKTGELEAEVDKAKANNNELKPKSSSWEIGITCFF